MRVCLFSYHFPSSPGLHCICRAHLGDGDKLPCILSNVASVTENHGGSAPYFAICTSAPDFRQLAGCGLGGSSVFGCPVTHAPPPRNAPLCCRTPFLLSLRSDNDDDDAWLDENDNRVVAKMPSWLQHVSGHLFLHQDLVFLHHQVQYVAWGTLFVLSISNEEVLHTVRAVFFCFSRTDAIASVCMCLCWPGGRALSKAWRGGARPGYVY